MADNRTAYGIRWSTGANGRALPNPIECFVASGQTFDVNGGASNIGLGPGDPVLRLSSGAVRLCDGTEGSGGAETPFGIVVGVGPYWDGNFMVRDNVIPDNTVYGSILERQSKVYVVPIDQGRWELDVDDKTTATTKAAYQALVGENADIILTGASGDTRAYPKLDISTHATTASLHFRIAGISKTQDNEDFSGSNVKLIVEANVAQLPWSSATGT